MSKKLDSNELKKLNHSLIAIQQEKIMQIPDARERISYLFGRYPVKKTVQNLADLIHFARCGMTLYTSGSDAYLVGGVIGRKLPLVGNGLNYATPEFLDNYVGRLSKSWHVKFEKFSTQGRYDLYKLLIYNAS